VHGFPGAPILFQCEPVHTSATNRLVRGQCPNRHNCRGLGENYGDGQQEAFEDEREVCVRYRARGIVMAGKGLGMAQRDRTFPPQPERIWCSAGAEPYRR